MSQPNFLELDHDERLALLHDLVRSIDDVATQIKVGEYIYHTQGFKDALDAVQYAAECTLATVDDFCMKKTIPVGEFKRQVSIAQELIFRLIKIRGCHYKNYLYTGRVKEVIEDHNRLVKDYALALMVNWHDADYCEKFKQKLDNY